MIPISEAIKIILAESHALEVEPITLNDARGRILAEDIIADTDLPPFDRSQMDGYAVRADDIINATKENPVSLKIIGESTAGRGWRGTLQANEAVRIMTGAPVPVGADGVQQVELTRESVDKSSVEIFESVGRGKSIVKRAAEVECGKIVLQSGTEITAATFAVLASFGYARVKVRRRPRVAVLATGSELVSVEQKPDVDQIRDSNSYTLAAYVLLAGATVERLPLIGDSQESLQRAIAERARVCDVLILSGGVSVGDYDFTKPALRALGAEIFFERVALKPGKPTIFARLEMQSDENAINENVDEKVCHRALIFGLPGNPVSVAVTFNLFARTALRAMQGARETTLREETAILAHAVKGTKERASYLPAQLYTNEQGQLIAETLRWGGSSDFVSFARANALVIVPAGVKKIEAAETVKIVYLPN